MSTSHALVIGFDNINADNYSHYFGHVEKGFSVTPTRAPWYYGIHVGQPAPYIFFGWPTDILSVGQLEIKRADGGLFTFKSFDTWSFQEPFKVYFWGLRQGKFVTFGSEYWDGRWWYTTPNKTEFLNAQCDTLWLKVVANTVDTNGIDNIVVDPVPEPTGLAVVGVGAVGLVALRRRRWAARGQIN